jgi:hypothetical protein
MFRRSVAAGVVLFVLGGFVLAESYTGIVTKLEKDKVTIKVRKKGEKKGEQKTFKVTKDTKIQKRAKKGEEPETVSISDVQKMIDKGFKIGDKERKGVFGKIETKGEGDDETATSITVGGGRRGKAKGKPKKDD